MAAKQRAAATIIAIDSNRFYLLGVQNKEIYGLLNDPSLPASHAAASNGATTPSTLWADKSTKQIYNDILTLFSYLVGQASGLVTRDTSLALLLSPQLSVQLGAATDFNVSVLDMLKKYFRDLKIVALPELSSATAGESIMLVATEIAGTQSAELAYGEKTKTLPWVRELSSMKQKWVSTTYGGVVWRPFAFATMTGC